MSAYPFGTQEQQHIIDAQEGDVTIQPSVINPLEQALASNIANQPTITYAHEGAISLLQLGEPG